MLGLMEKKEKKAQERGQSMLLSLCCQRKKEGLRYRLGHISLDDLDRALIFVWFWLSKWFRDANHPSSFNQTEQRTC